MKRVRNFLRIVFSVFLVLAIGFGVLAILYFRFHYFTSQVEYIREIIIRMNSKFSSNILTGISVGSLFFVLFVVFIPLFSKKIHKENYVKSLLRGVISAFVFFIANAAYEFIPKKDPVYLLLSVLAATVITLILVEVVSLSAKEEEEVAFRTDIVSAITSGLLFSVLLQFGKIALDYIKSIRL